MNNIYVRECGVCFKETIRLPNVWSFVFNILARMFEWDPCLSVGDHIIIDRRHLCKECRVDLGLAPWWETKVEIIHDTCECDRKQGAWYYIKRLVEELVEYRQETDEFKKAEELADCWMAISELLEALTFGLWRWVLPGGEPSRNKGIERRAHHGCPRSWRNACTNPANSKQQDDDAEAWVCKMWLDYVPQYEPFVQVPLSPCGDGEMPEAVDVYNDYLAKKALRIGQTRLYVVYLDGRDYDHGLWDDVYIVGVYSTKEKADAAAQEAIYLNLPYWSTNIKEFVLDAVPED